MHFLYSSTVYCVPTRRFIIPSHRGCDLTRGCSVWNTECTFSKLLAYSLCLQGNSLVFLEEKDNGKVLHGIKAALSPSRKTLCKPRKKCGLLPGYQFKLLKLDKGCGMNKWLVASVTFEDHLLFLHCTRNSCLIQTVSKPTQSHVKLVETHTTVPVSLIDPALPFPDSVLSFQSGQMAFVASAAFLRCTLRSIWGVCD